MIDKKAEQALVKEKMRELNNQYRSVRRIELILPVIFIPISFLLYTFLPIPWDNLAMLVPIPWFIFYSHLIKNHSEYFNKRATIIPDNPDPLSVRKLCFVSSVIMFATGIIFFMIEVSYSQIELEMYFEANEGKFEIIGMIIVGLVFGITAYFVMPSSSKISKRKQNLTRSEQGGFPEEIGPEEERKGGN